MLQINNLNLFCRCPAVKLKSGGHIFAGLLLKIYTCLAVGIGNMVILGYLLRALF